MTNLLNRNVRLFNAVNEFGGMSKISIFEKTDDFEANSIITMSNLTHGLSAFANESDDRFGDYFDGSFEIDQPDDMLHPAKINPGKRVLPAAPDLRVSTTSCVISPLCHPSFLPDHHHAHVDASSRNIGQSIGDLHVAGPQQVSLTNDYLSGQPRHC